MGSDNLRKGAEALENLINGSEIVFATGPIGSILERQHWEIHGNITDAALYVDENKSGWKEVSNIIKDYIVAAGDRKLFMEGFFFSGSEKKVNGQYGPFLTNALVSLVEASKGHHNGVLVAPIGPENDCYTGHGIRLRNDPNNPEVFMGIHEAAEHHYEQIQVLADAAEEQGVDLAIVYETIPSINAGISVSRATHAAGISYGIRFCVGEGGYLKASTRVSSGNGETIEGKYFGQDQTIGQAIEMIDKINSPVSIGLNCSKIEDMDDALEKLEQYEIDHKTSYLSRIREIHPNPDDPCNHDTDRAQCHVVDQVKLARQAYELAKKWNARGANITVIAGCCGTNPEYITALDELIKNDLPKLYCPEPVNAPVVF